MYFCYDEQGDRCIVLETQDDKDCIMSRLIGCQEGSMQKPQECHDKLIKMMKWLEGENFQKGY